MSSADFSSSRRGAAVLGPRVRSHSGGGSGLGTLPLLVLLGVLAIIGGYLVGQGETKVFVVVLAALLALFITADRRMSAPLLGVVVLVVLNGLPVVNVAGRLPGGVQVQDITVICLAVLLYVYGDRSGKARAAPYARAVSLWSACLIGWWVFTVGRTALLDGVSLRNDVLFGRDFLYFAILLPLALNARVPPRSLRTGAIVVLGGAVIYAAGQTIAGVTGVTLSWLVHPAHDAQVVGLSRFYSPVNYLVDSLVIFSGAMLVTKRPPIRRGVVAAIFAVLASSAIFGLTRANYFGLVVALLAAAAVYAVRHGSVTTLLARLTVLLLVVVAAVTLVTAITGHGGSVTSNPITKRVSSGISEVVHGTGTFGYRKQLDTSMLQVLGSKWPVGLGFLHPASHYVPTLPQGSIRNGDTGVFNALMTMGLVGVLLMYAPLFFTTRELLRVSRRMPDRLPHWILYGGIGWLAWALAGSATLIVLFSTPGVLVATLVLTGLGWAMRDAVQAAPNRPRAPSKPPPARPARRPQPKLPPPPRTRRTAPQLVAPAPSHRTAPLVPNRDTALPAPQRDVDAGGSRNGHRTVDPEPAREAISTPSVVPASAPVVTADSASSSAVPVSVVVVTYNSAHCISACIGALRIALGDCEVVVVDNKSTDDTVTVVAETDARVRVISMDRNAGFGSACNRGVAAATSEHVILMNPDVRLQDADLDGLRNRLADDSLGLVALSLRTDDQDSAAPQTFGASSWWSELSTMALGPFRPRQLPMRSRSVSDDSAVWAAGALLLVRRKEFLEVGGFDERFFLYYEDQELGMRYRDAGLPVQGTDVVTGAHNGGQSVADDDKRVAPMAWCLLGWLEFVAMQHGARRAQLSWRVVRATHRIGGGMVEWGASLTGLGRLRRKAAQLRSVDALVLEIADAGVRSEHDSCPAACRVVASTR